MDPQEDTSTSDCHVCGVAFKGTTIAEFYQFLNDRYRRAFAEMRSEIKDGIPSFACVYHLIGCLIDLRTALIDFTVLELSNEGIERVLEPGTGNLLQGEFTPDDQEAYVTAQILEAYFEVYVRDVWVVAHTLKETDTISQTMIQDFYRDAAQIERVTGELLADLLGFYLLPISGQVRLVKKFLKTSQPMNRRLRELLYLSFRTEERKSIHTVNPPGNLETKNNYRAAIDPSRPEDGFSEDGRTFRWCGCSYSLPENPSKVVGVLYRAYVAGTKYLSEQYIKTEAEVDSDMRHIVRDNDLSELIVPELNSEGKRVKGKWGLRPCTN